MDKAFSDEFSQGLKNLLINCADAQFGDKILFVHESSDQTYFGNDLPAMLSEATSKLGLEAQFFEVPFEREPKSPDFKLSAEIAKADKTVFFARIGDQMRFRSDGNPNSQVVSYALDSKMLSSRFGTTDCRAFEKLKQLIDGMMARADNIRVTCPLGTDFGGYLTPLMESEGDVTIKRFPMTVFKPADAEHFSGRVAQAGFLVGTGSHYYTPYACELEDTLFVEFKGKRIVGFDGTPATVAAAEQHYQAVGKQLGIEPYYVHSWHAGIHPGCAYYEKASENFERWSGGAFGNPRMLHFHTCGAYPPGEISLNIVDPTIAIDGIKVWDNGRLHPERVHGGQKLMETFPGLVEAFDQPQSEIGLGPKGALSFI